MPKGWNDGMRKEKPEDIITAIYDLSQLKAHETTLLSVFAVLPAEKIGFNMLETLLQSVEILEQNLSTLSQMGWIEYNKTTSSYKCSPVVQEITKKKNPQLFEVCRTLIDTLIDKLDYEPGTGHFMNATYEEAAIFTRYAESIEQIFSEAEESTATFCERIGSYHSTTGNLEKALGSFEDYRKLEKELYEAYPNNVSFKNGLAISFAKLGVFYRDNIKDKKKASAYFQKAEELWVELVRTAPQYAQFQRFLAKVQRDIKDL